MCCRDKPDVCSRDEASWFHSAGVTAPPDTSQSPSAVMSLISTSVIFFITSIKIMMTLWNLLFFFTSG